MYLFLMENVVDNNFIRYNINGCENMVNINEKYQVVIEKQDHFGLGIVRINGFLVFIEGGLAQDEVIIRITDVKKKYAKAKLEEIIKPSSERVKPMCPYYDFCGGCQLMHQDYPNQLKFKEMKVKELFTRFTNLKEVKFNSILHDKNFNYRNKVIFHGNIDKLGFYKEKTHQIIPIPSCLLIEKELDEIYKKILVYKEENPKDTIDNIMIRKTSLNDIMVTTTGNINVSCFLNKINSDKIKSVYVNDKLACGSNTIIEVINDMKFHILPKAFFQVNYNMMKKLYQIVIDYYKENNFNQVLDLYCGTGTIGMLVSPYVKEVIGVEVVEDAINSAKLNKELNNISNIDFLLGKVEDYIESFKNIDSIIVDPPRSGLDKLTVDTILKIEPQSIIYVSCDPTTLVRDLNILSEKYDILEVTPVDMFPNTYHVECVCVLKCKETLEYKDL